MTIINNKLANKICRQSIALSITFEIETNTLHIL